MTIVENAGQIVQWAMPMEVRTIPLFFIIVVILVGTFYVGYKCGRWAERRTTRRTMSRPSGAQTTPQQTVSLRQYDMVRASAAQYVRNAVNRMLPEERMVVYITPRTLEGMMRARIEDHRDSSLRYHTSPTCFCLKTSPRGIVPEVYWETRSVKKCAHCLPLGGTPYVFDDVPDPYRAGL